MFIIGRFIGWCIVTEMLPVRRWLVNFSLISIEHDHLIRGLLTRWLWSVSSGVVLVMKLQWFESTEGRYMASLLVRILSCGSCCGWRGHCVTCTVCHTQSICSVESWVLRWLHSPILELHTFSQCGQNTFGEDFVLRVLLWLKRPMRDRHRLPHTPRMCSVESWILRWLHSPILELHTFSQCGQNTFGEDFILWVLLWLKRPMRDRHCLPHTEHLLCRVMSSQMKLQSNLGVAYLLTVWTEHFWWGLYLVGLAVAEEANAWQALFATNWASAL